MYVISYCNKLIYLDHIKWKGSSFKLSLGYELRFKFVVLIRVIAAAEL